MPTASLDRNEALALLRVNRTFWASTTSTRVHQGVVGLGDGLGLVGVQDGVVGELDVVGRQGLAVVPLHAGPELEGVDLAVGGDAPALRQLRDHLHLVVDGHQAVEDVLQDPLGHHVGRHDGVQGAGLPERAPHHGPAGRQASAGGSLSGCSTSTASIRPVRLTDSIFGCLQIAPPCGLPPAGRSGCAERSEGGAGRDLHRRPDLALAGFAGDELPQRAGGPASRGTARAVTS